MSPELVLAARCRAQGDGGEAAEGGTGSHLGAGWQGEGRQAEAGKRGVKEEGVGGAAFGQ